MGLEQEIRDELVAIKKRVEQLIKNIDKVTMPQQDLFSTDEPAVEDKTFKKSTNPFFKGMKDIYLAFFELNKGIKSSWGAKDSKGINNIVDKIILTNGWNKKKVFENPEEYTSIYATFNVMLIGLQSADKFTFDNLSVNLFDSRFSTIASKIKNITTNTSYETELRNKMNEE